MKEDSHSGLPLERCNDLGRTLLKDHKIKQEGWLFGLVYLPSFLRNMPIAA